MSSLNSLYIKKEALETLLKGVNAKGLKGIELTLSINDEGKHFCLRCADKRRKRG